jgi:peptide deformylase
MSVLEIITAPHPVLEARAREVRDDEFGEALAQRASDMAATMYAAPGVGLAAPQVGDGRRLVVIDSGEGKQRGVRFFAMANPVVTQRSDDTIPWVETCLSVPDLEVEVQRNRRVKVVWRDPGTGDERDAWFEDYEAVIVQHELDHLEGTVLLDRVSGFKRRRYLKKLAKARAKELA